MAEDDETLLIYTTWPNRAAAEACARAAVEAGLAACVNLFDGMTSVYRWEGRVETGDEAVAVFKTVRSAVADLHALVRSTHPYELPCILALALDEDASSPAFLAWISSAAAPRPA